MDSLVVSNILHRKTRTVVSAAGVALGVVLVVLTVGLVHGFLNEQGRRNSAVTAEIMFFAQGGLLKLDQTPSIPEKDVQRIQSISGVKQVVPVCRYYDSKRLIDGIDYNSYTQASGMRVVEGKSPSGDDEAIVDRVLQRERKLKLGDELKILNRQVRVVGIYEPESFGRVKVPIDSLQRYLNTPGLYSMLLIRLDDPSQQDRVYSEIKAAFPDNSIYLTRDLPALYSAGTPALQTFLKVVVALSIIVSSLVILLAMYTTVTERTRQIGVLKSLGASNAWVAGEVEKEAILITALGVIAGFAISVLGKYGIQKFSSLSVSLDYLWFFYALGIGLISGALGALYPALRAARQDPVKALSYE